jgi:hypothetical protein
MVGREDRPGRQGEFMRKILCAATAALLFGAGAALAAGVTITVTHDLDAARPASVIAVPFKEIDALSPGLRMYHVVVRDPKGHPLTLQVTNYQHDHHGAQYDDLVFSYDFARGEKQAVFTLEPVDAATPPVEPCAYARLVSERFDDMAWENDRIAHRMYGMALDGPAAAAVGEKLRGSGVDIWAKRVTYPIVDRWYQKGHDQLHKDGEGEGLDLYSIGGARGDGGTGVWDGQKLWTSDNFAQSQVLSNGPRRAVIRLGYASWDAGATGSVEEQKQITVDCGRNFDAQESTFKFDVAEATVAVGLTEHPQAEGFPAHVLTRGPDDRWISLWEENKDGGLGTAVILAADVASAGYALDAPGNPKAYGNHLLLVKARSGQAIRYFSGAGWNRSGQFKTRADWESYVTAFAAQVAHPLKVALSARP